MKIIKIIFGLTKITAGALCAWMFWHTLTKPPTHREDEAYTRTHEMLGTKINEELVTGADLNREESEDKPIHLAISGVFAAVFIIWGGRDLYSLKC